MNDSYGREVKKGCVIQVNENCKTLGWTGCLMIVDKVESWGVIAYIPIPCKGDTWMRLKKEEFCVIGLAMMVHEEEQQ